MLDLIEVKPKLNMKKVVALIVIIIAIVFSFALLIINGQKRIKVATSAVANIEDLSKINEKEDLKAELLELEKEKKRIPVYSEDAKIKMSTIYGPSEKKVAYLTFDDGPSESITPLILDVLKQYNVKATFFVLGTNVERYPEIVKRAYEEGNYIGNHGYTHRYEDLYALPENAYNEYLRTEECIKNAIQVPEYNSHLFRFPGGSNGGKYNSKKQESKVIFKDNDVAYLDWNCLTEDAIGNPTKEQMMLKLQETMVNKNSLVILMHDSYNKVLTYELLPEIIIYLQEQGYTIENFYSVMQ